MNLQIFPGAEKIFEADRDLFWRLKPNLEKVEAAEKLPNAEHRFRVSTDGGARRVTPEAPAGARSVLFVGDSCTFGIPVDDDQSFPSRVGRLLGVRALNAGVPGYSAFQGRLVLERFEGRPAAVVITFWVNGRTVWDHLSDAEHQELLAAERAGEFSRHRLTRLLRRVAPGGRPRLSEEEFRSELETMIARSREIGARPLLVIWPAAEQMSVAEEHPRQAIIRAVGVATGSPAVELASVFRENGGSRLFVDSIHATAAGYEVAAAAVAEALRPLLER